MICIVSGTNRKGSRTFQVTKQVEKLYQDSGAEVVVLDLKELPASLFTPDSYSVKPTEFTVFSETVLDCEGLVVVTPEYNGAAPGVLKYFIDMLKFPESFERRPVTFIGVADGMFGALRSIEQLEQVFRYRNAYVYAERVLMPNVGKLISPEGEILSPEIRARLESQTKGFIKFCKQLKS